MLPLQVPQLLFEEFEVLEPEVPQRQQTVQELVPALRLSVGKQVPAKAAKRVLPAELQLPLEKLVLPAKKPVSLRVPE